MPGQSSPRQPSATVPDCGAVMYRWMPFWMPSSRLTRSRTRHQLTPALPIRLPRGARSRAALERIPKLRCPAARVRSPRWSWSYDCIRRVRIGLVRHLRSIVRPRRDRFPPADQIRVESRKNQPIAAFPPTSFCRYDRSPAPRARPLRQSRTKRITAQRRAVRLPPIGTDNRIASHPYDHAKAAETKPPTMLIIAMKITIGMQPQAVCLD